MALSGVSVEGAQIGRVSRTIVTIVNDDGKIKSPYDSHPCTLHFSLVALFMLSEALIVLKFFLHVLWNNYGLDGIIFAHELFQWLY